jgi:hypothetical protein
MKLSQSILISTLAALIALSVVNMGGCVSNRKHNKVDEPITIQDSIADTSDASVKVKDSATSIDKSADVIKEEATTIDKKVPGQVEPEVARIKGEADLIKGESVKLREVSVQLINTSEQLQRELEYQQELQGEITNLQEDLAAEQEEATQQVKKFLFILVGLGVLVLIGSIIAKSISGAAAGIITLCISLAIIRYIEYLALAGAIVLGVVAVYIFYEAWKHRQTRLALEESVETAEIAKTRMSDQARQEIYGNGVMPGAAASVQSKSTQTMVVGIRKKLNEKTKPTVPNNAVIGNLPTV